MHRTESRSKKPLSILLVDDDAGDRMLTGKMLQSFQQDLVLASVEDGEQALSFLRRKGSFANVERPDLIFLDLNIPKKSGHEVLSEIRADQALAGIPVIILSTSVAPDDVSKSYKLNANAFVAKSVDLDQFRTSMHLLMQFWCKVAKIPTQ